MISIKKTIYATLKDKIKKLRFLGQNDPKGMKKLLSLVAINFVYDWVYFNDTESEYLKQLHDLQTGIILNDCTFKKVNKDLYKNGVIEAFQAYRNVNTPQSNDDWKRVWDAPNVKIVGQATEITAPQPWIPDATCTPIAVYFDNYNAEGYPAIDVSKLTTCEKMNVYINRFDNTAYYLDYNGNWVKIQTNGVTEDRVKVLIEERKQGVKQTVNGKNQTIVLTDNKEDTINNEVLTIDDVKGLL